MGLDLPGFGLPKLDLPGLNFFEGEKIKHTKKNFGLRDMPCPWPLATRYSQGRGVRRRCWRRTGVDRIPCPLVTRWFFFWPVEGRVWCADHLVCTPG